MIIHIMVFLFTDCVPDEHKEAFERKCGKF